MLAGAITASIRLDVAERAIPGGGAESAIGVPGPGGWVLLMLSKVWSGSAAVGGAQVLCG
jgi:hypothetical protein